MSSSELSRYLAPGKNGLLLALFFLATVLAAEAPSLEEAAQLLARSDVAASAPATFRAHLAVGSGEKEPSKEIELWKGGEELLLIRFLDESEKGKWLIQNGDDLFFLTPNTSKPVKLSTGHRLWGRVSMREMLGFRYARDYRITEIREEAPMRWILHLEAKVENLPYPEVNYVLDGKAVRPSRIELRLPSGRSARLVSFPEWTEGEVLQPKRLVLKDLLRRGLPIEVEFLKIEPMNFEAALFDPMDSSARDALATPKPRE